MQTPPSSTPLTIFGDVFRVSMKSCGGKVCSKGVGALTRRRSSLLVRVPKSIAYAAPIRICRMTRSYRSILMNGFVNIACLLVLASSMAAGSDLGVIESVHASQDAALDLDPTSAFWRAARPVYMEKESFGKIVPRYRTEVRTRWTSNNLYFLFTCPYAELHLKPSPNTQKETNELWNWDVAEVFVGSDFQNIKRYKEFEVSPQGEWVDLDIDRDHPQTQAGIGWNSGFTSKTHIDADKKIWYCEMRIPLSTVDTRPPEPGLQMRVNLYRIEGALPNRVHIAWQP